MEGLKSYIGTKIILGKPMTQQEFQTTFKPTETYVAYPTEEGEISAAGYYVKYADGYESWSPKKIFEDNYRRITPEEAQIII